jgi:hypothetical protein
MKVRTHVISMYAVLLRITAQLFTSKGTITTLRDDSDDWCRITLPSSVVSNHNHTMHRDISTAEAVWLSGVSVWRTAHPDSTTSSHRWRLKFMRHHYKWKTFYEATILKAEAVTPPKRLSTSTRLRGGQHPTRHVHTRRRENLKSHNRECQAAHPRITPDLGWGCLTSGFDRFTAREKDPSKNTINGSLKASKL